MKELMFDIETFDTKETAVVFQIGWIVFENNLALKSGLMNFDVQEQIDNGRTISADTLKFWLDPKISGTAQTALSSVAPCYSDDGIYELTKTYQDYSCKNIWSKGSFDFKIMEHLFKDRGYVAPWKYYHERDLRTLMSECGVEKPVGGNSHHALEDCRDQLQQLNACRSIIKNAL